MSNTKLQAALTFDDGPNEPYTSMVLDTLGRYGVRAAFFVCGRNVEAFPDTVRRMVNEGHLVGNHTFSHSKFRTISGLAWWETLKTARIIHQTTGVWPTYFRPPYGLPNPLFWFCLRRLGYRVALWDVDGRDWERPSATILSSRIVAKIRPGAVVLLHDGHNVKHGDDRSPTVEALPLIIEGLRDRGYEFVRLDEIQSTGRSV